MQQAVLGGELKDNGVEQAGSIEWDQPHKALLGCDFPWELPSKHRLDELLTPSSVRVSGQRQSQQLVPVIMFGNLPFEKLAILDHQCGGSNDIASCGSTLIPREQNLQQVSRKLSIISSTLPGWQSRALPGATGTQRRERGRV